MSVVHDIAIERSLVLCLQDSCARPVNLIPVQPVTFAAAGNIAPSSAPVLQKSEAVGAMELGSVFPFTTIQSAVSRNMLESLAVPTFRVGYIITTDALYKKMKLNINIAVAMATDDGLITLVLQDADKVDVYSLSRKWKELVNKAHEYNIGIFTLFNLEMSCVDRFDAILPPGCASGLGDVRNELPFIGLLFWFRDDIEVPDYSGNEDEDIEHEEEEHVAQDVEDDDQE
ncbi:hypothetical protein RJT34_26434 [Clitoria ternatea]|uniref:2-oxoacid dehydrogenase acyltransferase catalytic domain-containing protein n=1 Tax=Clitoria ternatea TaxID=43366 RepID=A0AAN9F6U6_CLITE